MKKLNHFLTNCTIYNSMKRIKVWKLFPALVLFMVFSGLSAQDGKILSIKETLAGVEVKGEEDGPMLESLLRDVHKAIYLDDGKITIAGKNTPSNDILVAFSDVASIEELYVLNPDFARVKLLRVEITGPAEAGVNLDLSRLIGFGNLKYVLVLFSYDACGNNSDNCLEGLVHGMISGTRKNLKAVIYQLSIPE